MSSELKRAQDTMREAKEEAEKANRAQEQNSSQRMSHELRTPAQRHPLASDSFSAWNVFPTCSHRVSNKSSTGGRHLLDLINEVLDIARIEAGSMEMTLERVNAASALAEAALFTGPLAEQHRVRFVSHLPADSDLAVTADRGRLLQVLLNLFSNAVKYNREGGEVRYACENASGPGDYPLFNHRHGSGFDAGTRPPGCSYRSNASTLHQRGVPGTGIGLTITKSLVEAMGGAVGIDPRPGEGCTFYIDMPAALGPRPAAPGDHVQRMVDPIANRRERGAQDSSRRSSIFQPRDRSSGSSKCAPTGACSAASDGRAGLAAARDQRPDVILLDLHLPDLPGEEVIRRLHHEPRTAFHPGRGAQRGHHAGTDGPVKPAWREGIRHHPIQDPVAALDPRCVARRRAAVTAQPFMIDPNILVVDDEAANVALLEAILHRAGYATVRGTTDSREVARLVSEAEPDLVFARFIDAVYRWLRRARTTPRLATGGVVSCQW